MNPSNKRLRIALARGKTMKTLTVKKQEPKTVLAEPCRCQGQNWKPRKALSRLVSRI